MTDNAMGSYSDPNITPPMGQAAPLGLQHVLAMFASNVTPSIICLLYTSDAADE